MIKMKDQPVDSTHTPLTQGMKEKEKLAITEKENVRDFRVFPGVREDKKQVVIQDPDW